MGTRHWLWLALHTLTAFVKETSSAVKCNSPGELIPNRENCRKYYKCSNGDPSLQSCPGNLIFDPVLKICNWPDSTTCIADLLPKRKKVKLDTFESLGDDDLDLGAKHILTDDVPISLTPTDPPSIRKKTTPTTKVSKRILSLFHTKDRKFNRFRTSRPKLSDKRRDRTPKPSFNPYKNRDGTSAEVTAPSVRVRSRTKGPKESSKVRLNLFRKKPQATPNLQKAQVSVRAESSVSSVSSSVRVSPFRTREGGPSLRQKEVEEIPLRKTEEEVKVFDEVRPFSNGRGGNQFEGSRPFSNRGGGFKDETEYIEESFFSSKGDGSQLDDIERIRENLFPEEVEITTKKPKSKPIKCHTGASNELYANPRNCRKYYKCQNGSPSLQSCPANLIFDTNLKICNWPTASSCEEDPDAVLPEHATSDREPPKPIRNPAINAINIDAPDDYDTQFFEPELPKKQHLPFPEHGSIPTKKEALLKEEYLKDQYPLFAKVKETVKTLDTDIVEKIEPKDPNNPDNVKRVEFILSEENYEDLFPRRHLGYTYKRLLQAIGKFPAICSYVGQEEKSDAICRKTLATMFAHFTQETGNHNPSDKEYDEWRQGLSVVREQGCTNTSPGCGYNDNCEDKDSITKKWACGKDRTGKWKKYFGRGAKQLSYNFNYGQFSQAMFGDRRLLLDYPDFVADTWLNLASATWFYTTPQPPKPSMLHVIDSTWVPNQEDKRNGISPGFGATINIINGGLECNTKDGRESRQALNRIEYYKQFAWYLYVDYEDEELGCAKQQQFSAGGAGALPIYWDKDWSSPYSCKLVNYQTAHSALVQGEYIDCVEENFKVSVRKK